jgi:hypothetical protein
MAVEGVELLYTFSGNEASAASAGLPILEIQVDEFAFNGSVSTRVL